MTDTQRFENVCTKQRRIAQIARQRPQERLTALNQYLDIEWARAAYGRVRKDSAPGVDGQTVADYGANLESHLQSLLNRAKSGSYQAPPVRRVHIPKDNKETRPIGIPTTEDKVLQRSVVMLLEPIYEEAFYDFSYGFRPGRSPHQALTSFWRQAMGLGIQWVLEVDIRKYFDSVDRQKLLELVGQRIGDGVILRLLSKWLHAGVMEEGQLHYTEAGTPQGGVVSPLLSNIFLHEVFDQWFAEVVQERMAGRVFAVRFADDLVIGFTSRKDAERVYRVIFQRFEKYGLKLHPEKTKLVAFARPGSTGSDGQPTGEPETFDFLGFPLVGPSSERSLGDQKAHCGQAAAASHPEPGRMVPTQSALKHARAVSNTDPQTGGALRVLRHHRKRASAQPGANRDRQAVVQMAAAAESRLQGHFLETFDPALKRGLCVSRRARGPLDLHC